MSSMGVSIGAGQTQLTRILSGASRIDSDLVSPVTPNFAAFQTVSGDNHPIHYDLEYCRRQGHPGLLAHGFQVLAQTAAGAGIFPHVIGESLIGFIEQSSRFLKPVYSGDTVYPLLTITALTPGRTTGVITVRSTLHNQRRELCMEGEQKYLVRRRPPAA